MERIPILKICIKTGHFNRRILNFAFIYYVIFENIKIEYYENKKIDDFSFPPGNVCGMQ